MKWAGLLELVGEMGNVYKGLVGNPEGRRLLRRLGSRWKDKVKVAVKEMWCESVNSIQLA
jgi:hypothetical protein